MSRFKLLISTLVLFQMGSMVYGDETSWLRTRALKSLNPNLSVTGDFVVNAGPQSDSTSNRFSLREAEIGLQASVDPYAKADFFVAFPEGEAVELEEGYVTLLALPLGLKARGGKFLANFGRINMTHTHELPFVNTPQSVSQFLGDEGLRDTGGEISRIFGLGGIFSEITYGFLNGLGAEEEATPATTTVTDSNGNTVTVVVQQGESSTQRQIRNFAHVGRLRFYKDLTDTANLELGFSGALHQPKESKQTKLGGIDATFRWKPLQKGQYNSVTWRGEFLYSDRFLPQETSPVTGAVTDVERRLHRRAFYTYVEVQPLKRWKFGILGDYTESPEAANTVITLSNGNMKMVEKSITRTVAPFVTFVLSEFNRFRLQYENRVIPGDETEHRGFLQWTIILGPHGAHPY